MIASRQLAWHRMGSRLVVASTFALGLGFLTAQPAAAVYFVLAQTQNFTDGFVREMETNGVTILTRSTGETLPERLSSQFAQADLGNGLLRARSAGTQLLGSIVASQGQAIMLETLRFNASAPFTWDFSLNIEGVVSHNQPQPTFPNNFFFFTAALFVYDATSGPTGFSLADYFGNQASAAFAVEDIREIGDSPIFDINGSLPVPAGSSAFELVLSMRTTAVCQAPSTPGCSFEDNFASTAAFAQSFDTSVASQTSDSGVFLTGRNITAAPEPASLALLGIALGALGFMRRRAIV